MLANLFDYITWRGDATFQQFPFNELDALAFAQISYVVLDNAVSEKMDSTESIQNIVEKFVNLPDYKNRLKIGFLINDETNNFFITAAKCPRYKDVLVCGYRSIFSEDNVEQFAAITFIINKQLVIAYRGTDDSVIGFQEDFEISYKKQIPAQKHALEYFKEVAQSFHFKKIIIVGHSKGGNLAVNTAVMCENKFRKKINAIYNFDGPGFNVDFYKKSEFKEIESKLFSYYPYFSVVGMLFHHPERFEIVESDNFGIMQHDALSWQVMGAGFVNKSDFSDECKLFAATFNNWIDKISMEERKEFVSSLFYIIKASECKNILQFEKNIFSASRKMIAAYAKMDKNKKIAFKDIFKLLIHTVKNQFSIFKANNKNKK